MTDKSFGDYSNRNTVKNPLLSNAVTGLSIEDLTHNTFLLPAVRNQGLISSQDGMHNVIESNTERTDFQSGDTKPNIQPTIPSNVNTSPTTTNVQEVPITQNINTNPSIQVTNTTKTKTEDDFDVNEYFARLQGTRYVSAPKNCPLKDQNANLEENLEEINLNDSQNSNEAAQGSITADIAQNFSQLPQVLPQVASAVFSSFSNMLSLKSREQTPDYDGNRDKGEINVGFQDVPFGNTRAVESVPDVSSTNFNVAEGGVVAAPPKEPPRFTSTPSTYRMTAKKKTYAPIPGLSTGDVPTANVQGPTYQNPKPEMPKFFDPSLYTTETSDKNIYDSNKILTSDSTVQNQYSQIDLTKTDATLNIASSINNSVLQTEPIKMYEPPEIKSAFNSQEQVLSSITEPQPTGQIIPPPLMFSNVSMKSDGNTPSVSRSILPPSVARRINSQQIKTTTIPAETNFFIPQMPSEDLESVNKSKETKLNNPFEHTSAEQVFTLPPQTSQIPSPMFNPLSYGSKPESAESQCKSMNLQLSKKEFDVSLQISSNTSETFYNPQEKSVMSIPEIKSNEHQYPTNYQIPNFTTEAPQSIQDLNPLQSSVKTIQTTFSNPTTLESKEKILEVPEKIFTSNITHPPLQSEPPKNITEPPKLVSNQTYRLVKKKPQYYSGPIEGIGSVSNNVKPFLPMYEQPSHTSYQGSLFTPDQSMVPESTPLHSASENPRFTQPTIESQSVFDISRPVTVETINVQSIDLTTPPTTSHNQPIYEYNMAFDMSRPTTETYTQKQESTGYGILGSLKSKLGAIDINKIQNSVTTFFDPGYNIKNNEQPNIPPYNQYSQESNLEIFVPNVEQQSIYSPQPSYQYNTSNDNYSIGTQPYSTNQDQYQTGYSMNAGDPQNNSAAVAAYSQYTETPLYSYSNLTQPPGPITLTQESSQMITAASQHTGFQIRENRQGIANNEQKIAPGSTQIIKDVNENNMGASHVNFFSLPTLDNGDLSAKTKSTNSLNLEQTSQPFVLETNVETKNDTISFFKVPEIQDTENIIPVQSNLGQNDAIASTSFFTIPSFEAKDKDVSDNNKIKTNLVKTPENFFSVTSLQSKNIDYQKDTNQTEIKDNISTNTFTTSAVEQKPLKSNDQNVEKQSIHSGIEMHKKTENTLPAVSFFNLSDSDTKTNTGVSNNNYFDRSPENYFAIPSLDTHVYDNVTDKSNNTSISLINVFRTPAVEQLNTQQTVFHPNIVETAENENKNLVEQFSSLINKNSDGEQFRKNITGNMPPLHVSNEFTIDDNSKIPTPKSTETGLHRYTELEQTRENLHITQQNYFHDNKQCFDVYDSQHTPINSESQVMDDKIQENLEILSDKDNELNICETCREVNKPEEKDIDDLTRHLIENITAPIQLQNPVEAPFPDVEPIPELPTDFVNIDSIVEDERLDDSSMFTDNSNIINFTSENNSYSWSPENSQLDETSNIMLDDINAYINDNPNPLVGYFGDETMFYNNQPYIPTNASDEIKAEYGITDNKSLLQNLLAVPSAPNLADIDDLNTLDVQQIEQDAKNDYPIYDEYIIEPSETDDDKIEYRERRLSSEDESQEIDSFTNRVDKYKKLEESSNYLESSNNTSEKDYNIYECEDSDIPLYEDFLSKSSQVEYLTSYLDSTNYAEVEQFRNATESPDPTSSSNTSQTRNVPLRNITEALDLSFSGFHKKHKTQLPFSNVVCEEYDNEIKAPDMPKETPHQEMPTIYENANPNEPQPFKLFDNTKSTKESNTESVLADPKSFFSSNETSSEPAETETEASFNRLASYFSSAPKEDNTKSFFELSQSQNHYRQDSEIKKPTLNTNQDITKIDSHQMSTKSFFELGQSQNHYKDNNNQLETLKLMKDLTSSKYFTPNKDDVVKTVNYFVVEYDNQNVDNKCDNNKIDDEKTVQVDRLKTETKDEADKHVLIKTKETLLDNNDIPLDCKYCCNNFDSFNKPVGDLTKENYKYRKVMDNEVKTTASDGSKGESDNIPEVHTGTKKKGLNVNFDEALSDAEESVPETHENRGSTEYTPVKYHWFYRVDTDGKSAWLGFSVADSKALEEAFHNPDLDETTVIATDGGRFDVNVLGRLRIAVYWSEKPTNVRRCSWFYKGSDVGYVPYTEAVAELLEDEYRNGINTGVWHRRITLPNNEAVVMHSPTVMVHFPPYSTDTWGGGAFRKRVRRNPPKIRLKQNQPYQIDHLVFLVHGAGEWKRQKQKNQSALRPLMVTRGYDDAIQDEQPTHIDHLLMFCHGVGPVCDMSFRSVEEVVNDFRSTSLKLTQSHYKNSCDSGAIGRVEMLPISWHSTLHSGENGVDSRLAQITLESIPKLRNFTNDTILDVLFYTSPTYSQTIIDAVCKELNRIYVLFMQRNPNFKGGISLAGHSLGSVILYDLLCNQINESKPCGVSQKKYVETSTCTVQPNVKYPHLEFNPDALYALGSPIAIFEFIRGVQLIGEQFSLPTCPSFFNIFHPYDPIAYRVEPLINPELKSIQPFLIPHHKGRKRMHLELKETMARVSADIKQKLFEVLKASWYSMWRTQPPSTQQLEKVVEEEVEKEKILECKETSQEEIDPVHEKKLGQLNQGRRIDYVLQEAPIEMFNEYIFAIRSHVCYWESEDVMLLMLREIYLSLGIEADCSVPQQSMTVERTRAGNEDPNMTIDTISEIPTTSRKGE